MIASCETQDIYSTRSLRVKRRRKKRGEPASEENVIYLS